MKNKICKSLNKCDECHWDFDPDSDECKECNELTLKQIEQLDGE